MSRALLLNASYEPHLIIPARRMVRLYMDDKVEAIEYGGLEFRSANFSVLVPSVARLYKYIDMPEKHRSVMLTPKAVLARDGHVCGYCGVENLRTGSGGAGTMDHIIPRAKGGRHTWENVTASCRPCNSIKRDYTLDQMLEMGPDKPNVLGEKEKWAARWTLTRKPFRPNGVTAYLLAIKPEPEWLPYLGVAA